MPTFIEHLAAWLDRGGRRFGQILLQPADPGWELRHEADESVTPENLTAYHGPAAARELAKYTDAGAYRPLKTAPNLRRGWRLAVVDLRELLAVFDAFYPSMVANWVRWSQNERRPTPLRETLNRQTGMYRITAMLTDDEAQELVQRHCRTSPENPGCLRKIPWGLTDVQPLSVTETAGPQALGSGQPWPFVCCEACNLLVAAARGVVKARPKS